MVAVNKGQGIHTGIRHNPILGSVFHIKTQYSKTSFCALWTSHTRRWPLSVLLYIRLYYNTCGTESNITLLKHSCGQRLLLLWLLFEMANTFIASKNCPGSYIFAPLGRKDINRYKICRLLSEYIN